MMMMFPSSRPPNASLGISTALCSAKMLTLLSLLWLDFARSFNPASTHPVRRWATTSSGVQPERLLRTRESRALQTSSLFGITEWRDRFFDFPGSGRSLIGSDDVLPKQVCILPFDFREVLLQGETKQLRLYEERFIKLFDDCIANHDGVVGMGLLADSGIIQAVPLCEVEAYNRLEGFGIFVTIRAVGRAKLLEISTQEPYLKATCLELTDLIPPNLELPRLVAENIDSSILTLSAMEHRLEQAETDEKQDDSNSAEDAEMRRRIMLAKLEDRFYEEPDDEDEDGDEDEREPDRKRRFSLAYEVAMQTDTQGYQVAAGQDSQAGELSPQELTALSWAAFSTQVLAEEDAAYRIQALDSDNLFDRLKLALHMLRQKKTQLRARMERAGLKFGGEDGGDADESSKDA